MTTYFESKCHCGLNHFKIAFENTRLPCQTDLCHCSSCRHSTGQMCINDVLIKGVPLKVDAPDGVDEPANLDGLIKYQSSDRATRYSCKRCFAHYFFVAEETYWGLFTGLLEKAAWGLEGEGKKAIEIVKHLHVQDSLDGGMADHVRDIGGKRMLRHAGQIHSGELEVGWKDETLKKRQADTTLAKEDTLPFYCQCKTISFKLVRPPAGDASVDDQLIAGEKPEDPVRFHAAHCLCTSCRLTCGSPIQSWVVAHRKYIIDSSTAAPLDLNDQEKRPKGLVRYESSPGIFREGCGTCGASVFYGSQKHEWIDICAGLVDEEVDGVRAENWICWTKKVLFPEDAVEPGIVHALRDGVQATLA